MTLSDRRAARLATLVQTKVPEPVQAAAIVVPQGRTVAGLSSVSALLHDATQQSAVGFAPYNALGFTTHGLYAFVARISPGIKIGQQLGYWPWGTFDATTSGGSITRSLSLLWAVGSISHLEARVIGTEKYQDDLIVKIAGHARRARRAHLGERPPHFD